MHLSIRAASRQAPHSKSPARLHITRTMSHLYPTKQQLASSSKQYNEDDAFQLHTTANTTRTVALSVTEDDDDIVFMAQPTVRGGGVMRDTSQSIGGGEMAAPKNRYIAGEEFFNYAAFGSLREGQQAVSLFSSQFLGLAVNAMAAGVVTTISTYILQPLLIPLLAPTQPELIQSISKVLQWPVAFSVFMGLVSDCYPLFGYRRKSYMMLGWLVSAVTFLSMALVYYTMDASNLATGYLYLIFATVTNLAGQTAWIASLSMAVEFAQREHLTERGHLIATYYALHFSAAAVAQIISALIVHPQGDNVYLSDITFGSSALILAVVSILTIPCLHWCLLEEYTRDTKVSVASRLAELWNFLQQKVVYCIVLYIVVTLFLFNASSPSVMNYALFWSGYDASKDLWVATAIKAPRLLGVLIFKLLCVNVNWRIVGGVGLFAFIGSTLALALPVAGGAMRGSMWAAYLWLGLGNIAQGCFELFIIIPLTEIADIGREGVTIGLINSFMTLIGIAGPTLWQTLNDASGFKLSDVQIFMDEESTRHDVRTAAFAYAGIQLIAVIMLWFLPKQKMDAQQLRAFGGYNSVARLAIVVGFSALLIYDLATSMFSTST